MSDKLEDAATSAQVKYNGLLCDTDKEKLLYIIREIDRTAEDYGYYSGGGTAMEKARSDNAKAWKELGEFLGT